ncbi:acyltransferase [Morganella sp. GD04133]|uniref:acyltransferase family protein n=1 Tax=Morganella sp. GD04133 TaxID=2975435 RepID=UPI00244798B7|nr:acyltransferase [Morganella sp. GD04133]MDH0356317.1 acyltransferase [Morganella sp. GD04133]
MGKIISIHHLRGIAALSVVFFHFRGILNNTYAQKDLGTILFGSGAFGVDMFFMISGFIIALSTEKATSSLVFATRRFFRIYPAFIVIFLIGIFTVYKQYSGNELLKSMLFVHRDYGNTSPGFGFNILGPAWTLGYEIYFYFIFMISMAISWKYRLAITSVILASPIIILQFVFSGALSLAGNASPNIPIDNSFYAMLRFVGSPILIEFIIGMILFFIYKNVNIKISKELSLFVLLISTLSFLSFYFNSKYSSFGMYGFGFWSLFLIVGFLFYDKFVGFKENIALNFMGNISYSIYLSHYIIIQILNKYRPEWWMSDAGISKFLSVTTLCILAAALLYVFIEKPFIKYGKKIEWKIKSKAL